MKQLTEKQKPQMPPANILLKVGMKVELWHGAIGVVEEYYGRLCILGRYYTSSGYAHRNHIASHYNVKSIIF